MKGEEVRKGQEKKDEQFHPHPFLSISLFLSLPLPFITLIKHEVRVNLYLKRFQDRGRERRKEKERKEEREEKKEKCTKC